MTDLPTIVQPIAGTVTAGTQGLTIEGEQVFFFAVGPAPGARTYYMRCVVPRDVFDRWVLERAAALMSSMVSTRKLLREGHFESAKAAAGVSR